MENNKSKKKAISIQFTDWILDKYDHCFVPKQFYVNLNKIYNGTYPICKNRAIPLEELWELWELSWNELEKIHYRNERQGKEIEGYPLIMYDISILISKYDEYKRKKESKKQSCEKEITKEKEIDITAIANRLQREKVNKGLDISKIIDDI